VFAGVRPQEIMRLEPSNLKLDRKILEITKAKTRRRRIVHLSVQRQLDFPTDDD
jgi:integrase